MVAPGIFEQLHHLQGMDTAFMNLYEEPEATHELIDYLMEYELAYAEKICENYHPDAIFHHDDWGSYRSSFMSPDMFEEFLVPVYKKIYVIINHTVWKSSYITVIHTQQI
jgi:uroporphyrinogen-III decarboxylase